MLWTSNSESDPASSYQWRFVDPFPKGGQACSGSSKCCTDQTLGDGVNLHSTAMFLASLLAFGIEKREFRVAHHSVPSATQNVTINIQHEKPEQWPPCFPHKLQQCKGAKDLFPNKSFKIDNDALPLTS